MTPAERPWGRATAWLALLAPLFFLSYGWANAYAASLPEVATAVYDWERVIPFWAWTIVPYWSIDLFYGISLFVCRDRHELDRHALRLLTAQVIAVSCFFAFPLRLDVVRPPMDGVIGWMFDVLQGFDQPFNQAPSLHIVLLVLLWLRFGAHLRGGWRWVLHAWAALIGISVLTTWQHHFIDVPTGLLAGFFCAWLWPMRVPPPWRQARLARDAARWRLAAAYFVGAALLFAASWVGRGWMLWLAWPAVAMLLVALNYAWLGTGGFQKDGRGRMSVAARWLYAPYLVGVAINAWAWTRRAPQAVNVVEGVWLGRMPARAEAQRYSVVIDVCAEWPGPASTNRASVPMLDLVAPTELQLVGAAGVIDAAARAPQARVLVCCALGFSRSALAVAAWLILSGRAAEAAEAIECVQRAKPAVVLRERHRELLMRCQARLRAAMGRGGERMA